MFEGLVRQLLLGYLGQYIKDIHREQLKITLWNEEVLLENVELILEAFDYLQLPFALKQGRVGRLSIKIPWKKLGWDPIIIILEDVLISACQRDDEEWSMDAVERREFAGKKAKLAAAELGKLSRRVCDNQAGKSFLSYLTAKILDGIQVSIRNFHVAYCNMPTDSAHTLFGLKFSSLTAVKQNLTGLKVRGGQVNKLVEIKDLEIYCGTFHGTLDLTSNDNADDSVSRGSARFQSDTCNLLAPVDVSMSLVVNRSGRLENNAPQYSVNVELTELVMSLDEVQLQQILILCDYLCMCRLRDTYGRYRPWWSPLSKRLKGWQIAWWHYVQQSVLSDVRKRLRKSSWKYLGERLHKRRKYVKLYKTKLEYLREEQLLEDNILWELEQIEKESDIDDILSYRSAAERELQELPASSSGFGAVGADIAVDKSLHDEHATTKPRGWLNWLSRGMLGAGGTADSSQFSGVVSDEVIKDIYEATKFHPMPSLEAAASDEILLSSVKLSIRQISTTLRNKSIDCPIAELIFEGTSVDCMIWEEFAVVTASVNTVDMMNPLNKHVIITRATFEESVLQMKNPFLNIIINVPRVIHKGELSIQVMVEPLEVMCDSTFLLNIIELYAVLESFKSLQERVLLSLNRIDDVKARVESKAEYILSRRKRLKWDASFIGVKIIIPWENAKSELHNVVMESGAFSFASKRDTDFIASDMQFPAHVMKNFLDYVATTESLLGFQLHDLYDHFEIKLNDLEVKMFIPSYSRTVSVLEKLNASITLSSCIVPDESLLKALQVYVNVSSLFLHFSPSIYSAMRDVFVMFSMLKWKSDTESKTTLLLDVKSKEPKNSRFFGFSGILRFGSANFLVELENDFENSCTLMVSLQELDARFAITDFPECWICTKALKIVTRSPKSNEDGHILCSSENTVPACSAQPREIDFEVNNQCENCDENSTCADGCFLLRYEVRRKLDLVSHSYTIWFSDLDLHCYPHIVGLLVGFSDKINRCHTSPAVKDRVVVEGNHSLSASGFEFQKFGYSNFYEAGSSEWSSIPLGHYPFITIENIGSLLHIDSSLIYPVPEWRNFLKLREGKIRSPGFSVKKGSEKLNASSTFGKNVFSAPPGPFDTVLVVVNLNLSSIRVHFHDSSCIVGTVTLCGSKSALSFHEDSLDILCSSEGLNFSSSWWSQTLQDFLWGPSLPNLSPILNVRVRKGNFGSLSSVFEISFSIQHVSCTLPPEYLAIIIGYFSLPDWSSTLKDQPVTDTDRYMDTEISTAITYKFEILDSVLFTPVESVKHQFLKLDIRQLYCSFIHKSNSDILLKDIPAECLVPAHKVADKSHCLNLFGRDLFLSLLLPKDDTSDSFKFIQNIEQQAVSLIAPICADVWIRIPHELESHCASSFASTCVMSRISNCQLVAEGADALVGFEALQDVIDQFSSVPSQSQGFTSDVLQFLQLKRRRKQNNPLPPESSVATFTEIKCSVNSMLVKLYSKTDSTVYKHIAESEMRFICSASLKDDRPLRLDLSFSSLALFSSLRSLILVECTSPSPVLSVLATSFSLSDEGENELHVALPSVDIWLHLSDWSGILDLFSIYSTQVSKSSTIGTLFKKSALDPEDPIEDMPVDISKCSPESQSVSSYFLSETIKHDDLCFVAKSENVGIKIHIPVQVRKEAFRYLGEPQVHDQSPPNNLSNMVEGGQYCFVVVTLQSRCCELIINGHLLRLKSNLDKTSGTVELSQHKSVHSWPFFQLLQVNVKAEIRDNQMEHMQVIAEVQCESFDVCLSHHIFYFWQCMLFELPGSGSSQFPWCRGHFKIQLGKLSLLLTDRKWSSNGPLLEVLVRNVVLDAKVSETKVESSVDGELRVNYNNIHKVFWEPFVEPWKFQLTMSREYGKRSLLSSPIMTDIHLESTSQLNLNVTESFIEVVFWAIDMIKDAWDLMALNALSENPRSSKTATNESAYTGRYAPYILQNFTSLPLVFHVCEGPLCTDGLEVSVLSDGNFVQPGSSYPVYIDETPEEQFFDFSGYSYGRLNDKQRTGAVHRYITIQLEGTSILSTPISMDLVGVSYVEVDFSKSSNNPEVGNIGDFSNAGKEQEGNNKVNANNGYVIPVVIDVSVLRHTKLVRLYSTVILLNSTSVPFEVRFDIPFGVSPKILDPIYPGQEFPLPLHLAEAGRIRWRPLGSTYLWSEAYSISSILSHESRIGFLRSFVCYPSLPSSDPFRCCITVHDMCLPSVGKRDKGSSLYIRDNLKQSLENCSEVMHHPEGSKKRFIHLVTLSSPLVVKNYLPVAVSVTVESGGVTRSVLLSEAETSFFHIDSSHDLAIVFQMVEFRAAVLNFPRVETFGAIAKFSGTKFSLSETIAFDSDFSKGPLYVTMEKVLDAFSGAREICISVPFLLYNCCGFSLSISNSGNEMNTHACIVPSCYDSDEQNLLLGKKDGLGLISSNHDLRMAPSNNCPRHSSINSHVVSTRKDVDTHDSKFGKKSSNFFGSSSFFHGSPDKEDLDARISSSYSGRSCSGSSSQADMKSTGFKESDNKKANFCMYSPDPNSSPNEVMVKVSHCISESVADNIPNCSWSSPFFIVPPTGSTNVLVPQKFANAAYIISATSSVVAGPFSGRTRIISFQPRYVISNACSKDLCYKQKGSEYAFHLKIGQNSHIQWTDLTRDLLVSVRFNEPGWQWSGCFVPEHLGDTQLKMRNYVSGAVNMIRVEVQNADVSIRDEKLVGNPHGNSGTYLILLSDDDTGFMPYRIDNFSKERLRVFQQRCEAFETVIHSYTSCSYAWDEPCYPHRLTVEVPAERIIGSYTLDDAKEHKPVYLPATSEKPERTLLVSVHSEGAMKVLSVIDSSYHILDDMKGPHVPRLNEEREHQQEHGTSVVYKERISVAIPFIGISVMNSSPQELLFACAKNTVIDLVQSLDQQKYSLEISSLQIDNQLQSTPYPVILSFDHEYRSNPMGNMRTKDSQKIKSERIVQLASDHSHEPVFSLAAVKWRNKDVTLVSFEYISLRVADCHLELEQEVILSLFDFFKMASSRFQSRVLPNADTLLHPTLSDFSFVKRSCISPEAHEFVKAGVAQIHSTHVPLFVENDKNNPLVPSIVPIGAPWQQIYLLARKQKKVYVERFDLAPIKLTLSFSSSPWMLRNGVLTSGEYLIHRGLMALADVEGAQIHLKQLTIAHQLASWESIREILIRHYTRQLLHEMYKVFGSAGVIGNPMGFARSVGLGIKDFLSVPARSFMQSPAGLIGGMAQGTTSLLSNTVYAVSDAATQFSRAVHKGIIAFTFDDPAAVEIEKQQKGMSSHSKGVINEFLEGLTGLLQSPIKGAEKHGLPGVLSGIALGVTGLVARPAASILEVTGKTAQSIRNRSKLYHRGSQCFRIRLPRPLSKDSPLKPYLWEEAVGTSVLANAGDSLKLKNEVPVMSKALGQGGKFVIVTKRLILIVSCSSLVNLGKPDFRGVPTDPEWVIEAEIGMDSIIHADTDEEVVHIVGSSSDTLSRQNQHQQKRGVVLRGKQWYSSPTPLPLFQTNLEFQLKEEAVDFLRVLLSAIEKGKQQGWGSVYRLHQINVK